MKFTWDDEKNVTNQAKHRISFEEASRLFTSGVDYLEVFDQVHSNDEERFIAIGGIDRGVVVIVWTEQDEEAIRIISARLATRRERAHHEAFLERNL